MPPYDENLEAWCEVGRWVWTPDGVGIISGTEGFDTYSSTIGRNAAGNVVDPTLVAVHLTLESGDDREIEGSGGRSDVRLYRRDQIRRAKLEELPVSRRPVPGTVEAPATE